MRLVLRTMVLLFLCQLTACATSTHLGKADHARIAGRTYVIVGASSGFGRGTAVRLGRERANLVLAARRAELLEEVAAEVRAGGGQALVVPTDVSDPAQVESLAEIAVRQFGRIDVWMNIAGVGAIGRFWDVPVADYSRLIDINFKGVVYGSHAPMVIFRDGEWDDRSLNMLHIARRDVVAELRQNGRRSMDEAEIVVAEHNGGISIITKE